MMENLIMTLCLEENTLLISEALIDQLGSPSLIQIRINEKDQSLIVQPCEYGVIGAIVIPENRSYQLEFPADTLVRRIRKIMEWADNEPRVLPGVYIPQHNVVFFSLNDAHLAILKPVPSASPVLSAPSDTVGQSEASTLPSREGLEAESPEPLPNGLEQPGEPEYINELELLEGDLNG